VSSSFRSVLLEELSEWLPEEALGRLASAEDASAAAFADRGLRSLLPLGLEASGLSAAASLVRALPGLLSVDAARNSMFGLEKIARAHAAPELLVRAAHGVCACALSLGLTEGRGPEAAVRSQTQLVSALVRLVTTSTKAKVPVDAVLGSLARALPS
jgi:hypothetical protein